MESRLHHLFLYPAPSILSIEMTSQHSWFRGPELRSIVFDAPTPSTWIEVKPTPWSEAKSYWFDLAKPPKKVNWSEWGNNPDTSNWKF